MFAYSFALVERAKAELARLTTDRKGVTALEYGILAAVIVLGLVAGLTGTKTALTNLFTNITKQL